MKTTAPTAIPAKESAGCYRPSYRQVAWHETDTDESTDQLMTSVMMMAGDFLSGAEMDRILSNFCPVESFPRAATSVI